MNTTRRTRRVFEATCVNSLPAHSKGRSCLDDVTSDRAAIVPSRSPGKLGSAVGDLLHCYFVRRTWWT